MHKSFLLLLLGCFPVLAGAQHLPEGLSTEVLANDLRVPWDLSTDHEGNVWFTERDGSVGMFSPFTGKVTQVLWEEETHETYENSGMHSMALHPRFDSLGWVYIHYCSGKYDSKLMRYTFRNGSLQDPEELRKFKANTSHNGSRLVFDASENLYMCIGDAYTRDQFPQDSTHTNGKVLRMDANGQPAPGNPNPDSPVWAIGHRNPQGLCFGPDSALFMSEHGPDSDDELNRIARYRNYGWPLVLGPCDTPEEEITCDSLDIVEPEYVWDPTAAIAGMIYYDRTELPFTGSLLVGSLKAGTLFQVTPSSKQGQAPTEVLSWLEKEYGRIRDLTVLPDGSIVFCTSNAEIVAGLAKQPGDDKLIRIFDAETQLSLRGLSSWQTSDQVRIFNEGGGRIQVDNHSDKTVTLEARGLNGERREQVLAPGESWVTNNRDQTGVWHIRVLENNREIKRAVCVLY